MTNNTASKERSRIMRAVKSKDSKIEVKVRSALWRLGFRFYKNKNDLPGKPDIAFPKKKLVIFIDSCFWHGCPEHLRRPNSNQEYWNAKIARNRNRDFEVNAIYQNMGWKLLRVWEHELKKESFQNCINKIIDFIQR